ncbi:MAG: DUF2130 domain-containing protein [Terracidiphilus sp.]
MAGIAKKESNPMLQDLVISCPKCGEVIRLDETLAGPMISQIRAESSEAIKRAAEDADLKVANAKNLEITLAAKERELAEKEALIQTQVNKAIAAERQTIAAVERVNVLKEFSPELEAERAKAKELQERLTTAQNAERQLKAESSEAIRRANEEADLKVATAKNLETTLAARERELAEKEASIQTQVNKAIAVERQKIAAAERKDVLKELSPELEAERAKAKELQNKLTTAQNAELQLRKEKDAVDQKAKDIDLEIARKVDERRGAIYEQASKVKDEEARLKRAELEKTISDMQIKLEEAQRKATQGSQQTQGDVLEIDFEKKLRKMFPQDTIEPVKTGVRGADILQRILGEMGRAVGTMLWETKRAKDWSGEWTSKAKQDAAEAKADTVTIVSEVLPKGLQAFGLQDGVWCATPSHALALGLAIRQGIISTSEARQRALGRETKKDRLYDYMIGPEFRATVEEIALPFRELNDELMAEKRATLPRWKRQEKRIERVLMSIASLQGALQGIAGSEMPELPGFELESGDATLALDLPGELK